jgi:hypothetical protein
LTILNSHLEPSFGRADLAPRLLYSNIVMLRNEHGLLQAPFAEIEFVSAEKTAFLDGWVTALGFGALIVYFLSSLSGGLPLLNGVRWADTLSVWGEFKPALVSYTAVCGPPSTDGDIAMEFCPRSDPPVRAVANANANTKKAPISQGLFED